MMMVVVARREPLVLLYGRLGDDIGRALGG